MSTPGFVRGIFDDFELVTHLAHPELPPSHPAIDFAAMEGAGDVSELLAGLAQSVVDVAKADASLISLSDPERGVVRDVAASVVPPVRMNSVAEERALGSHPVMTWVLETGNWAELSVSDAKADAGERDLLRQAGFARVLICRFLVEGVAVGTIRAYRVLDIPFRGDTPKLVETLSSFATNAYKRIELAARLELHYMETMEALVSALEARDPYTEAHAGRISDMAVALAVAMKLPGDTRRAVRLGAILHDVGKIGIPDSILRKPGPLTEEEWATMRSHSVLGEKMLSRVDFLAPALPIVRHHHERWDGTGYPDRLAGEDIPMGARLVAVSDAFDAMTSDRPYRRAMAPEQAFEEIMRCAGAQFDPSCAALLVDVVSKMGDRDLEDRFVHYFS